MRFIYTKTFAALALGMVIVAIFLFLQIKGYIGPIRYAFIQAPKPVVSAAKAVASPVKNFFGTAFTLGRVVRQNGELQAKVASLNQDLILLDKYRLENEALKELGFVKAASFRMQPCSVLAIDPEQLTATMILDCGSEQGVKEGQAVVSQNYLVGKIISVGNSNSTAVLVTHNRSSIDARISKNTTEALVRGSSGAGLVLDQVPADTDLQKGDLIVTAGINDLIPKNILIGEVGEILSGPSDLFKKASVVSPVRFPNLQFIFVVQP